MSFPRYPKYKDSGVEWLGGAPTSQSALGVRVAEWFALFSSFTQSRFGNRRSCAWDGVGMGRWKSASVR